MPCRAPASGSKVSPVNYLTHIVIPDYERVGTAARAGSSNQQVQSASTIRRYP